MRHLRALHTECDKNGAETARRLGITGAAISQLLNGHNRPSVATAVAVAKVRRVSLSEVLGEAAT